MSFENLRDAHPRLPLDHLVRIRETEARLPVKFLPDGCFAAPHQPDQDDVWQGCWRGLLHGLIVLNPGA